MHPKEKIILSFHELSIVCRKNRESGKVIVLTSGCFDLLHGGHVDYIAEAGELGFLVVGINSDMFVKRLKGESRPIRDEHDRALTMAAFYPVSLVTIFDCDYQLIETVSPSIYVASTTSNVRVGDDRKRVDLLQNIGAKIIELGAKKQDSTTEIIRRATRQGV